MKAELHVHSNISDGSDTIGQLTLEQIAIENNCVCLEVDSSRQREGAHRFYEQNGLPQHTINSLRGFYNAKNFL